MDMTREAGGQDDPATAWEKIGTVPVETGQLMIIDPCWVDGMWEERRFEDIRNQIQAGQWQKINERMPAADELSYRAACFTTIWDERGGGNFGPVRTGGCKVAAVVSTGFGDGTYDVYVRRDPESGRIMGVMVDFE